MAKSVFLTRGLLSGFRYCVWYLGYHIVDGDRLAFAEVDAGQWVSGTHVGGDVDDGIKGVTANKLVVSC